MIAKAVKGTGFRGALAYDLNKDKEHSQLIDTNMAGLTPRALAREFGTIRALRPNLNKAVLHVALSAAPGEHLTDAQWRAIGRQYLQAMGLEQNQYVMTRHHDTEHEHIHILANRIRFDGSVTSDSQDYRRQETLMRVIERDYDLQIVAPSREAVRHAPTRGELEKTLRTGAPSTRQQLQQLCDAAAQQCTQMGDYAKRLHSAGVALLPVLQLNGAKLAGLSYRLDGVTMKGSDLGKGYSPVGLAQRGIRYEQSRDSAAIDQCREQGALDATGAADRQLVAEPATERARPGGADRTVGASDGGADRRDAPDLAFDRAKQPDPGRTIPATDSPRRAELDHGGDADRERGKSPATSRDAIALDPLPASHFDRHADSSAGERILALAGPALDHQPARREASGRVLETGRDRSVEALEKQIAAMNVPRFEVLLYEHRSGKKTQKPWRADEVKQAARWLKRMNARGHDILIRPKGEHGLILLERLTPAALVVLESKGLAPAAVLETSPGRFQAWIKLSETPMPEALRRLAMMGIVHALGGDPAQQTSEYGRLAGFTNQAPQHAKEGRQPYVLIRSSSGQVAPKAGAYLEQIGRHMTKIEKQATREKTSVRERQRGRNY